MSQAFSMTFDADIQAFIVSGDMTLLTASSALSASTALFEATGREVIVDLKQVGQADSAGLALLIEWMRRSMTKHQAITFRHLPEQMHAIATASGLHEILPLEK